jgi:hypothetical protein
MRLAHLYALLDRKSTIGRQHLEAALAVWDYSRQSVEYVFGSSVGDPLADKILGELHRAKPKPVSRSDIRDLIGGRTPAIQVDRALQLLARYQLAHKTSEQTGGRPIENWRLGPAKADAEEDPA